MKFILIYGIILFALASCTERLKINNSFNGNSPFKVKEEGITHGQSFLTCEGDTITKTAFSEGQTFTLHLLDLKGIKEVNKEFQLEITYVVKNQKGEIVLQEEGIDRSISISKPSVDFRLSLDCDMQHEEEEIMEALFLVKDRNSEHSITATVPFSMVRSKFIEVQSNGLSATPIYLINAKDDKVVTSNRLPHNPNNRLMVGKLEGLTEKEGKVSYNSMTTALQPNGDTISQIPYLPERNGLLLNQEDVSFLPFNLNLNGAGNATFVVEINDEFSDKSLIIKTKIQLY